ncbi:MAG: hypothetical protein COZ68_05790 [Deltaproteobacteria bacterium CG_4_8_14_3_um_filter_43_13]|nr:MAG: hypothetical protein COS67_08045 [Deltaproteobacteria bacterium CG06_land_8_20_14_3_00_44_19]PIX24707.1 MAG: hypothetical protein COZ68_05790 [Deltaproteobacteria bacterium CG_4_8_14_3_um_filter_43_13]
MYENILTPEQMVLAEKLLPVCSDFYLAGGTALALQMEHRRSIDFDLASFDQINPFNLERRLIAKKFKIQAVLNSTSDEFSILIDGIKVTFFSFPFPVQHKIKWERGRITLPTLIELGAMKAYALGRRSKWKDYVDLYFLIKFKLSVDDLIEKSNEIFSTHFNSKLFREQLCYFDDIDYSETIEYIDHAPDDRGIKEFLEAIAVKV